MTLDQAVHSRRGRFLAWMVGLVGAVALTGCANQPPPPRVAPDVIKPAEADDFAKAFDAKRFAAINAVDGRWIAANEDQLAAAMDFAYANDVSVTKQPAPVPIVMSVASYVPHQGAYPASFISNVAYQDGSGVLLGFLRRASSAAWKLVTFAGLVKAAPVPVSLGKDGFALRVLKTSSYPYDPVAFMAWYTDETCRKAAGCIIDPTAPCCAPAGYRVGLVSDQLGDHDVAIQAQYDKIVTDGGFKVGFKAVPWAAVSFPIYQLAAGSTLQFVGMRLQTEIHDPSGCFTVTSVGQYINPIMPVGTFVHVTVLDDELMALQLPASSTGEVIDLAGSGVLAGDQGLGSIGGFC
jgi:hypothetical protein